MSIREQAAQWWVLLHCEGKRSAAHREFGEWMARSPERVEAYLQVARLMRALKSGDAQWPDTPAETLIREAKAASANVLALPERRAARAVGKSDSRAAVFWKSIAVAAVLAGVAVTGWLVTPRSDFYRTAFGEQRSVLLDDGSRVTLNTESVLEVRFLDRRRLVRLHSGEALFEVAHDASRPFDVEAGSTVLRAIGTQFNVDRHEDHTTVTVVEGRVAVVSQTQLAAVSDEPKTQAASAAGSSTHGERPAFPAPAGAVVLAAADSIVITEAGAGPRRQLRSPDAATAWLKRQILFDNRPLSEVAEEFNRYNRERIVIEDEALRAQQVTGVLQSNDPVALINFLANLPGVEIKDNKDGVFTVSVRDRDPQAP